MRRRSPPAARPGRVRVIGGRWRGRLLPVTDAAGLRPTPARVRETLFNWLAGDLAGARCLDLFAGSGALGLEAVSRGAASSLLLERDARRAAGLRTLLRSLAGAEAVTVLCADAMAWLHAGRGAGPGGTPAVTVARGPGASSPYDVVFVDPPFDSALQQPVLDALAAGDWLAPGARVYVECDVRAEPLQAPPGWTLHRSKTAGQVRYHLFTAT